LPREGDGRPPFVRIEGNSSTAGARDGSDRRNSTRIVQSIYGAIQQYAAIERPEWADLPS
jgi:hypothetical protein